MPVTLTVSQVRETLYQGDLSTAVERGSSLMTPLLGRWFHEGLNFLISNESPDNPVAALSQTEADLNVWRDALIHQVYNQFVGPKLTRHCVALQDSAVQVATFWQAMQAACQWLADLCWKLPTSPRLRPATTDFPWQGLAQYFKTEVPIECELKDPSWSDSVRLVGIADAIIRLSSTGVWCVVEYKTGSSSPHVDLGQACLYQMILSEVEQTTRGTSVDHGTLALIRFAPERIETLFSDQQLTSARQRLREVIGQIAGVSNSSVVPTALANPLTDNAIRITETRQEPTVVDQSYLEMGQKIVETFEEYGVDIALDRGIIVGPAFIRFPITLGHGMKVASVENRAAELQIRLKLAAEPFISRDRGRLVIDVQRPQRQTVYFDEIRCQLPAKNPLFGCAVVPIGVNLAGKLVCADLSKPEHSHLLVAGTTGCGKSEWLRMAIAGLIATNTPETLRLVLIDPKRNAFHALMNSRYLWQPVVFPDEQPADEALKKLCDEMDERYRMLDGADTIADLVARTTNPLPRIICVCDEYRDLISRGTKERKRVEDQICRLGAKARAAGIHLILATQEPSRDTIKGPLDSNMPARIALRMGRYLESNMLLGEGGAEKLLGNGDLLFKDIDAPRRLQAPLLTEENRRQIFTQR